MLQYPVIWFVAAMLFGGMLIVIIALDSTKNQKQHLVADKVLHGQLRHNIEELLVTLKRKHNFNAPLKRFAESVAIYVALVGHQDESFTTINNLIEDIYREKGFNNIPPDDGAYMACIRLEQGRAEDTYRIEIDGKNYIIQLTNPGKFDPEKE